MLDGSEVISMQPGEDLKAEDFDPGMFNKIDRGPYPLGGPPMFAIYHAALAAAATITYELEYYPEFWHVEIAPLAAGVGHVSAYMSPTDGGDFVNVYAGHKRRIPASDRFLTVVNTGAVAVDVQVIATRNKDYG